MLRALSPELLWLGPCLHRTCICRQVGIKQKWQCNRGKKGEPSCVKFTIMPIMSVNTVGVEMLKYSGT